MFAFAFAFFAAGLCVKVWRAYDVNYIHIIGIDYDQRVNQFQLWKMASILFFIMISFMFFSLEWVATIHNKESNWIPGTYDLTEEALSFSNGVKEKIGFILVIGLILMWINPTHHLYRRVRYQTIIALGNVFIAPFGNVRFKAYLLAECLSDCIIPMEDAGKIMTHIVFNNWNANFANKGQENVNSFLSFDTPVGLKWYLYVVSFIPYWWRMNQNLHKWLVYGQTLQRWNALKYLTLIIGPVSYIIYNEAPSHPYGFKTNYYVWKSISTTFKLYWDFYWDWGLFRGTRKDNWMLRDNMKFPAKFYYICMILDIIGLYFWAVIIGIYSFTESSSEAISSLEFYNNVMWITWVELIVAGIRRTIWVMIRLENEFFNNFEQFRDILTIPPIKAE